MVHRCYAFGCKNEWHPGTNIRFHRLPFNKKDLLQKWIINMGRKDCNPYKTTRICSAHFLSTDYIRNGYLKPNSVPSIFLFTKMPEEKSRVLELHKNSMVVLSKQYECKFKQSLILQEIIKTEEIELEPEEIKFEPEEILQADAIIEEQQLNKHIKLDENNKRSKYEDWKDKEKIKKLQKQMKILQQKIRRQQKKILEMAEVIGEFKKKN